MDSQDTNLPIVQDNALTIGEKPLSDYLPTTWKKSEKSMAAIDAVMKSTNTVSETYANIPMICRGQRCPYYNTCELLAMQMDPNDFIGERCPAEIAKVIKKTQGYIDTLWVDETNMVDVGLVKELVDIEMVLDRINRQLAVDSSLTEEVVTAVNPNTGEAYTRQEVKKLFDLKNSMQNRKDKLLTLLNSTRKDKAAEKNKTISDPLSYVTNLMKSFAEQEQVIDVTVEDGERNNGEED